MPKTDSAGFYRVWGLRLMKFDVNLQTQAMQHYFAKEGSGSIFCLSEG